MRVCVCVLDGRDVRSDFGQEGQQFCLFGVFLVQQWLFRTSSKRVGMVSEKVLQLLSLLWQIAGLEMSNARQECVAASSPTSSVLEMEPRCGISGVEVAIVSNI
jgi:hypothetical protein